MFSTMMAQRKLFIALIAALGLGACATNQADSVTVAEASETEDASAQSSGTITNSATDMSDAKLNPDEVVCKNEMVLGTRFPKRICMTRQQWYEQSRKGRNAADRVSRVGGMAGVESN